MIVTNFRQNCREYTNFQIWEVEDINAFFKGNQVLSTIFENDYKMTVNEFLAKRSEVKDDDLTIINNLLDQVGDKHFFIFTLHDENHMELINMQQTKIMSFGMNIEDIKPDLVYITIMDKDETMSKLKAL